MQPAGIEPANLSIIGRVLFQLSYDCAMIIHIFNIHCGSSRIRTYDPRVKSSPLRPSELWILDGYCQISVCLVLPDRLELSTRRLKVFRALQLRHGSIKHTIQYPQLRYLDSNEDDWSNSPACCHYIIPEIEVLFEYSLLLG